MTRLPRIVLPGVAHHVTQPGSRRQPVFFSDGGRPLYLKLVSPGCAAADVRCLSWCLMDNHIHLILGSEDSLRAALGEAHRRYTPAVKFREVWRGYLFQGRFASKLTSARCGPKPRRAAIAQSRRSEAPA